MALLRETLRRWNPSTNQHQGCINRRNFHSNAAKLVNIESHFQTRQGSAFYRLQAVGRSHHPAFQNLSQLLPCVCLRQAHGPCPESGERPFTYTLRRVFPTQEFGVRVL